MKKILLAIVVAACLFSGPSAEAQEKPVDLIVLLDASQSMFPYFTDVVDFVVSKIAREYLRFGDTFHLLTFTDSVQIEIAQAVRTEQDIKSLLGRLYLLYPLGKSTDLVSALSSLYQYASDLPESNRKLIVMVTDGMHNPSDKSPYVDLSADQVRADIEQTTTKIRENGWTIRIVRVPFIGDGDRTGSSTNAGQAAASGGSGSLNGAALSGGSAETLGSSPGAGDYLSDVASGLGAPVTDFSTETKEDAALQSVEIPQVRFPGPLGKLGYDFSFPLVIANPSSRSLRLELSGVYAKGRDVLRKSVFIEIPGESERSAQVLITLPDDFPVGQTSLEIELRFADGVRVVPTVGTLSFLLVHKPFARLFRTTGRAVLFIVLLAAALALIIALWLYIRGLHKRSSEPIVSAVLDSEAAVAAERREALARARAEIAAPAAIEKASSTLLAEASPKHITSEEADALRANTHTEHVSAEEALAFRSDLVPKHLTQEEALSYQTDLAGKHVTDEEARIFRETGAAITDEEAKRFASSRAITQEEAARYRDDTSRSAAEALAAYAASVSPNRPSEPTINTSPIEFAPVVKRTGSIRVEFRVDDQNPNVGLRNVRTLHSGTKKTLGGRRSDFLVFLVPVPTHVADVFFDGEDLTLIPVKPEFFPDYKGPIRDCLYRTIRMVTKRGKPLSLRFAPYVPPADRINRLLHCVDAPGLQVLEDATVRNAEDIASTGK